MQTPQRPENRRRFARVAPSGLVSKTGTIIVDPKKPTIPCTVIDLSAGGACLDLAEPDKLPKRFIFMHGGTKKHCLLVWKGRRRIGVQF